MFWCAHCVLVYVSLYTLPGAQTVYIEGWDDYIQNDELVGKWKEAVVAFFKRYCSGICPERLRKTNVEMPSGYISI